MAIKTNFSIDTSIRDFSEKEKELKPQKEVFIENKTNSKYKGNILVRLTEEKHKKYKTFAAENGIKFNQLVLLSLAYTFKQVKDGKIQITDYGIETIPQR